MRPVPSRSPSAGCAQQAPLSAPGSAGVGGAGAAFGRPAGGSLPFDAIAPVNRFVDDFVVPQGYTWQPIIRWGDPLFSNAPVFDINGQTPAAQALQFGYNATTSTSSPTRAARPACS